MDKIGTEAMWRWVRRANHLDQIKYMGPKGFGHSAWERCMIRAQGVGLVEPNAHGEFVLTAAGKQLRRNLDAEAYADNAHSQGYLASDQH